MSLKTTLAAALFAFSALPVAAGDNPIRIEDPYARASTPSAKTGAIFLQVMNTGEEPDRLLAASSPAARKAELHTHREDGDGVMRMIHVEEGFEIPAGGMLMLERGGNHVMLMGLTAPLAQDATVPLTLTFEKAGEVTLEVPVDLARKPKAAHSGHGGDS